MDQDAFRGLLADSRGSQRTGKQGGLPTTTNDVRQKAATSGPSEPGFRPRKVKKAESRYRDRAAERREGVGNDYAQVEAVLEDFEIRVAHEDKDVIEQQRKYLGGDSQHTVLVKGLDMSLLEQNRARAATSTDDEFLEQAYAETTSTSERTEPRKRTREIIVRDLKAKRQSEDKSADPPVVEKSMEEDRLALEAAKKAGKFRPIGFKLIGPTQEKSKKRKVEGKAGVKKKKKVEVLSRSGAKSNPGKETPAAYQARTAPKPSEPEAAPPDEDVDIFAGAGDYEGIPVGEDSEGDTDTGAVSASKGAACPVPVDGKGWFGEPESQVRHASTPPAKSPPAPEEPQEVHLQPLESSALPSIRDLLAMDEAAEKAEKRKARKEKKKKKKKAGGGDDDDDDDD